MSDEAQWLWLCATTLVVGATLQYYKEVYVRNTCLAIKVTVMVDGNSQLHGDLLTFPSLGGLVLKVTVLNAFPCCFHRLLGLRLFKIPRRRIMWLKCFRRMDIIRAVLRFDKES